ncbi:succinate dehydrogenase cytochrome b subunit [Edaphocola flava]|jgi:succinate dehydrogenase / fumarate reductase cytochrome b subunit|uniref:succinate dehydrogenase cytochrome b subunit n=1 Tax=Edaphocola flava TaxID=2499629 RepID=UPI00100BC87F|nr:succinate dehydrogenase cytochrome b subunit [Edaphocola flava]
MKNFLTSSIGKKLVMGLTGLFLIVFLVVHCYANAQIFLEWLDYGRGYKAYGEIAHFLGSNPIIRIAEVGLFAFIILHIVQGLMLTAQNKAKRPIGYNVAPGNSSSKWYTRSMGLLGTLILMFLVLHLAHFWAPNRYQQLTQGHEKDLYLIMEETFQQWWVVIIYVAGCISLAWHLVHGFWSAFQTLGLSTPKYKGLINCIGVGFAIIVPAIFALMPISYKLGWLPPAAEVAQFVKTMAH